MFALFVPAFWHVDQSTPGSEMVTDVTCQKEDMIFIRYEPPDGQMRHQHLFNGGNGQGIVRLYHRHGRKRIPVDEIRCQNVGCEYGEYQKE